MKVIDIKDVPHSPNTGIMPVKVYNPLNEDFTHPWDNIPYTIPAGETGMFPEFLARHLAKHLAKKIVSTRWEIKINKEAVGQITPDTAKAVPIREVQEMMEALMTGKREAFDKIEAMAPEPVKVVTIEKPPTPIEEFAQEVEKAAEVKEEPKVEEVKTEVNPLQCSCGFVAKNNTGIIAHKRIKNHK